MMATESEQSNGPTDDEQKTETLSSLLQEYREIADLDIEQTAETLCLTISTIKALENEQFDKLPEPPYMRGYLRNYARFAEKDPAHIIDVYHQRAGIKQNAEEIVTASSSYTNSNNNPTPVITPTRFRFALITVLLLSLILLSMIPSVQQWATETWASFSTKETTTAPVEMTTDGLGLPSLAGNLPLPDDKAENNSKLPETNNASTADTENSTNTDSTNKNTNSNSNEDTDAQDDNSDSEDQAENADANTEDANSEQDPIEGDGNTHIKLIFSDKVWLRIRDNKGNRLYEAVNQAGTVKELKLNSPLKFKVGNANKLKLFIDGEEMDITEFTRGSVATFGIE